MTDNQEKPMIQDKALGKVGLANLGNTCFINSALQCLRYSPELTNYFTSRAYKGHIKMSRPSGPLVEETADVFTGMWGAEVRARASMAPRGFIATATRVSHENGAFETMGHGDQACSAEFIQFLIESLHEGLARSVKMDIVGVPKSEHDELHIKALQSWTNFYSKQFSLIADNYFGQEMKTVTCGNCGAKSRRFEPFTLLKVPVEKKSESISLASCFDANYVPDILEDYQCDACNSRNKSELKTTISRLPSTLIVHLKRFQNDQSKVRTKVDFDLNNVDMSPWLAFPGVARNQSTRYSVFGIVEHQGSSRGGHYVSYVKHNNSWVNYNDTFSSDASESAIVNPDTYILFMSRKPYSLPDLVLKDSNRE